MINLPQGFKVGAAEAVDARLILSKAEMKNTKDSLMPSFYFAVCSDDGKLYIYSKSNEVNEDTGKFRVYGTSSSSGSEIDLEWGTLGNS